MCVSVNFLIGLWVVKSALSDIIIIIIIIVIIIIISLMQHIHTYIPETNYVLKE